jgi:DNA-binding transcriptional regulator YhcF (GntR family)
MPKSCGYQETRHRPEALSLTRKHQRKTDRVLQTIRRLALGQQKKGPQIFLSLRKAALRFEVPVSTMAAIYHRLADEGILDTVRATQTNLRGRETSRSL